MYRISRDHVRAARRAKTGDDLHGLLQNAVRLEHATIPPYLAASYSLPFGINGAIRETIAGIAVEEMLHLASVSNVLVAIGGRPRIAGVGIAPTYPTPLPMSIGHDLVVGLKPFSMTVLKDFFMRIEEPEKPIPFPDHPSLTAAEPTFATIGEFYGALAEKIVELGDGIFTGDPASQVVDGAGFPPERLFPIVNAETAARALTLIRQEGEGTTTDPLDPEGERAHYYRFAEILHGHELVPDGTTPLGYSYSGPEIPFDPGKVHDFPANSKASDYPDGSDARKAADALNRAYSDALNDLQAAFGGEPQRIGDAVSKMPRIRATAKRAVETIDPRTGRPVGLTFEYVV